jgi:cold shock CspA family protein
MTMRKGRVDSVDHARGFGFAQPADGGPDLFFRTSVVMAAGIPEVHEGDAVEFLDRIGPARGKPQI